MDLARCRWGHAAAPLRDLNSDSQAIIPLGRDVRVRRFEFGLPSHSVFRGRVGRPWGTIRSAHRLSCRDIVQDWRSWHRVWRIGRWRSRRQSSFSSSCQTRRGGRAADEGSGIEPDRLGSPCKIGENRKPGDGRCLTAAGALVRGKGAVRQPFPGVSGPCLRDQGGCPDGISCARAP